MNDRKNQEEKQQEGAVRPWLKHYDPGTPKFLDVPRIALWGLLEQTAEKHPTRTALIFYGKRFSYQEVWHAARRFAHGLQKLGIKKGDRIALMLPNCPQFVIAFYGALLAGATVVGVNPLYTARELEFILSDSHSETLLILNLIYPRFEQIAAKVPVKRTIVAGIEDELRFPKNFLFKLKMMTEKRWVNIHSDSNTSHFPDFMQASQMSPQPVDIDPAEEVACLQYTGGTTGLPKAAMLTHLNLVANCYQVRNWTTDLIEGQETLLGVLPFFHSYALSVVLNTGVVGAATIVVQPRFVAKDCLDAIQNHRITFLQAVPTMYTAMNELPDVHKYDFSSIKFCNSGAAPLPLEVMARFEELTGCRVVEGYGLSEASPVTHSNTVHGILKKGSIGIPVSNVDARIVDENGRPLPVGEVGELVVRGTNVMKGYLNRPEETAHAIRDGWLFTGDLAKMDDDGFFYIVDRKKDMLIVRGFNVYPREIEEVLYKHPKIKEAVVAGIPDTYHGDMLKAFIVLQDGERANAEDIRAFCKERLVNYKVPREIEFRDELPKSAIGKYLRRVLVDEEKFKSNATSASSR